MRRALELADHAAAVGEVPVGAVAVRDGEELGAVAVIHLGGALWLAALPQSPASWSGLLTWSLLPFVGLDVVKALVAERLSRPLGSVFRGS